MDSVGAEDEVEGARLAVLEPHRHPVAGVAQVGDGVAEEVFDGVGGPVVHDLGQVAAQDLEVAAGELARHHPELAPVGVDENQVGGAGTPGLNLVEDAHPLEHGEVGPALEVHRLSARSECGGALDDGDGKAVSVQPVGKGGACRRWRRR